MPDDLCFLPDCELSQVAKDLQVRTQAKQLALLQYLREGSLTARIRLPTSPTITVSVPISVWKQLDDRQFNVRRRPGAKIQNRRFRLSLEQAYPFWKAEIEKLQHAAESKRFDLLEGKTLVQGIQNLDADSLRTAEDTENVKQAILARCEDINACAGKKLPVVVLAEDHQRFFSKIDNLRKPSDGLGGRPTKFTDEAWIELIAQLLPQKPQIMQKHLVSTLADKLQVSKSTVTQRIRGVYKRMGW